MPVIEYRPLAISGPEAVTMPDGPMLFLHNADIGSAGWHPHAIKLLGDQTPHSHRLHVVSPVVNDLHPNERMPLGERREWMHPYNLQRVRLSHV
jgi:hypothetical protein